MSWKAIARSAPSDCSAKTSCYSATSAGRYGLMDRHCAHRGADLAFGRLEHGGLRCAFHGWLFDATGQCIETPGRAEGLQALPQHPAALLSRGGEERHPLGLSRRGHPAGLSGDRLLRRARHAHLRLQGPHGVQLAAGARSRHRSRARLLSRIASSRTRTPPPLTASSFAARPPEAICQ
ncbi:Rieske 2Fe-2S domain-containing protein [Bradyrhizobium betae]